MNRRSLFSLGARAFVAATTVRLEAGLPTPPGPPLGYEGATQSLNSAKVDPLYHIKQAAIKQFMAERDRRDHLRSYRVNGLSPCIAALRLPLTTQLRMQRLEDEAHRSWCDEMRERCFPGSMK